MRGDGAAAVTRPAARRSGVVGALALLALLLAACGGGPSASPGIASIGSGPTTTTTTPAANGGLPNREQAYSELLAYSQCMRSHGVPSFPDPQLSGNGIKLASPANHSSPPFASAAKTCAHLLPNGGAAPSAAQLAAITARLLEFAACMRSHGVPSFPDPRVVASGQGLAIPIGAPGLDPNSRTYQSAQRTCAHLLPGQGRTG